LTLLPIQNQNHKGSVLKIAKVSLQICISSKFLAKNSDDNLFSAATAATLGGTFSKRNLETFQENKSKNQ